MGKRLNWLKNHLPTQRRIIQLYAALLHNAHLKGFIDGSIYKGKSKGVCVPGLNCYSCPGAVGACPLGSLQNAIASSGNRTPLYVIGIIMLFGLILGRSICGFLCPMGLLQELLHKIPTPKIKKGPVTRVFSWVKYWILAVFVLAIPLGYAMQNYPVPAFCKYICPAGTFEGAIALLSNGNNSEQFNLLGGLFTWKFLVLLIIILACVFLYRSFCRFICPLGALYGLFAKLALVGVKVDEAECINCGKCVNHCKVDIRHVGDRECIHCGECIDCCPTGAISFKAGKITLKASELSNKPAVKKETKNKRTAVIWIIAAAVLVFALVFFNLPQKEEYSGGQNISENTSSEESDIPTGDKEGMQAPDFTVNLYDGGAFSLYEQRGKTTVINFWATWCGPCCTELPYFDRAAQEYGDNISVIAVHSNLVTDDVQEYLSQYNYKIAFGLDETGEVIESFGGSSLLPHTVIIDKQGVIIYNQTGSLTYEELSALLTAAESEG